MICTTFFRDFLKNNGELVDDQPNDEQNKNSTGLFGAIKKLFGGE